MSLIRIQRGLDLPVPGALESAELQALPDPGRVALLPPESWGMKVQMLAQEGDRVQVGTPLYCDRRDPAVIYTSPAAGVVESVERGAKRAVLAVIVRVENFEEQAELLSVADLASASREDVLGALAGSGLWPALRRRPYDCVARSDERPRSIFVTAIDTEPLAISPREAVRGREEFFRAGLQALVKLSERGVWLCTSAEEDWSELRSAGGKPIEGVQARMFRGPHPAGLAGTHIHLLDPVGAKRCVWHVAAQDVADIGEFLSAGRVPTKRRVAVVGPAAAKRAFVETRRGAETTSFAPFSAASNVRLISGSLLSGRTATPGTPAGFLGRWDRMVTMLADDPQRELLGWSVPIGKRWSITNVYPAKFLRAKSLHYDTDLNGSPRAIVPIGVWERVMPLDVLPTQLIKALASDELEDAEKLGALELAEEDLALCEYVDQSKTPITAMLRAMLTRMEKEG
ncbi:MAG: NADH:ubiquinone reductase (Na(+)-transporting) subunit A [Planctomycetota bacterium]|nr:NADH:ubiquinone reductase (Na(+)-transporting) subunit A [Planctomycetota bacterium]